MTGSPKKKMDNIYLSCLSIPEAIILERTKSSESSSEKAILRFGFKSKENEMTFDVNKLLTLSMLEDLSKGINTLIKDLKKEEDEEEAD